VIIERDGERAHLCRITFVFVLLIHGARAFAAPEEVQVYMAEMNDPGQFGLDVHNSYVFTGHLIDDYPGEQQSLHRYRITPELAYGLTHFLELGVYLPLATIDRDGQFGVDGVKLRLKFIAPRPPEQQWFYGANFEIGRVAHALDENPYNAELKGIVGFRSSCWTVAFNANLDFVVSGPVSAAASLELATKISHAITRELALGIETYNGVGLLQSPGHFGSSEQSSFVAVDASHGTWDLNLGVGSGYGSNPDRLIVKAIVGVPID
jgi:hypothetical protein